MTTTKICQALDSDTFAYDVLPILIFVLTPIVIIGLAYIL